MSGASVSGISPLTYGSHTLHESVHPSRYTFKTVTGRAWHDHCLIESSAVSTDYAAHPAFTGSPDFHYAVTDIRDLVTNRIHSTLLSYYPMRSIQSLNA